MEVEQQTYARTSVASPSPTLRSAGGATGPSAGPAASSTPAGATGLLPSERLLGWVDRHRYLLFIAVAALYALAFNGQWRVDADSALYLTIGRNLAQGHGYTYHGLPHSLAYPGMPWLFAGLFKLFGTETLLPADVLMLACAVATLALVYRLFLLHAGRPSAVLVTVALALSRTFVRYSFELLSDMPFLMGVTAFLVGYEALFYRRYDPDVRGGPEFQSESAPERAKPRWFD